MNYFISFAIKSENSMMSPITHYGNCIMDLPHEIIDMTDIVDLQNQIKKINSLEEYHVCILWFSKLPI